MSDADTTTTHTYETACARIETIIKRLDAAAPGLRETLDLCREGRELVEFCAAELEAVGAGLEELRLDELVAGLESGRAGGGRAGGAARVGPRGGLTGGTAPAGRAGSAGARAAPGGAPAGVKSASGGPDPR